MRTLRIEVNRGRGWKLRAEGKVSADTSVQQIARGLQAYAIQYPHRALIDGVEVARAGKLPASATAGATFDALLAHRSDGRR
jgi:hypothetical protein